jgi:putative peptidoglycan lipid II flippase
MLAAARTVVAFGILLQFAGFARMLLIADYFGAGALLDAYYLGLIIPTFLTAVSAGTVQTAFVPAYVAAKARSDESTARALANVTLTWVVVGLSAVSLVLIGLHGAVVTLLTRGGDPETYAALQATFVLLVCSGPLNALADAAALLLNGEGRFAAAACAPLANVLASVIVLVAFRAHGIDALAWSLIAGLLVQGLVVLIAVRVAGIRLRPQLTLAGAPARLLRGVALPMLFSVAIGNILPAFIQMFSARAGTGAISAMGYASRLHNSLVQAVVLSVSVVLLPHFARLVAEGKDAELRITLQRLFAATLLFAVAAIALVAAGGVPAIRLLLEHGRFTSANALLVASVWLALTLGLLATTWNVFLVRLLQAQQRVWTILGLSGALVLAGVVLGYLFLRWGVVGVALANSVAYTLAVWLCHRRVGRILGRLLGPAAWRFALLAIATNLAAYAAAVGWGRLTADLGPVAVLSGQFLLVAAANLVLAAAPPLGISMKRMLGRA